jgi:hypothetical protein
MHRFCWILLASLAIGSITVARAANDRPSGSVAGESSPARPLIISREHWQAKPPTPGMRAQNVVGIILHHTGVHTNPGISLERKMRGLQSFSQHPGQVTPTYNKPAWPDIPYHFYIDVAGRIAEGRNMHFAGDTNTSYDTRGYIQVVVEGDFEEETPDTVQLAALRDLLVWLAMSWDVPNEKISVHKAHAPTDCPGRNFMAVLPKLLMEVAEKRREVAADLCRHSQTELQGSVCAAP